MAPHKYKDGQVVNGYTILEYLGNEIYKIQCNHCKRVKELKPEIFKNYNCNHTSMYHWKNEQIKRLFHNMKVRCYWTKSKAYKDYGGRGIYICDEWREEPEKFEDWCLDNGYESGLQIDRIDNDGPYSPDNCRFVDAKTNSLNRRSTIYLTVNDVTKHVKEWADELNVTVNSIRIYRRRHGVDATVQRIINGWGRTKKNE